MEKNPGEIERNLRAQIAVALSRGALDREGEADTESLRVTPGNAETGGDALQAGERRDPANELAIEVLLLLRRPAADDRGEIDGQDARGVEGWRLGRQVMEGAQQEAGAREEQERGGDLRDREGAEPPVRAGGASGSAGAEPGGGRLCGGQPRDVGEEDRRDQGQADAEPDEGGVEVEVVRAHGEPRRIPAENRDHRGGDEERPGHTRSTQQEALGEQRPPQRRRAGPEC